MPRLLSLRKVVANHTNSAEISVVSDHFRIGEAEGRIYLTDFFLAVQVLQRPKSAESRPRLSQRICAALLPWSGLRLVGGSSSPVIGVPDPELVAVVAAESDRSGRRSQEDALEALRLEFEAAAEQIPFAAAFRGVRALPILAEHAACSLQVMAEFVSDKADVPESRVRVRLGAVVTGRRPVDRLGNRAVVGRGTILAEPSARSLDGVAVSLDLRCGQVDAICGQRLGKGLDQAPTSRLPYEARLESLSGGFGDRTLTLQETWVSPRSMA